jgi:hypothetical protein
VIAQSLWRRATGWTILVIGFDSRGRAGIFLFTTASTTVLSPNQLPIQWIAGALSLGVKRPGREADHSLPSSAEVKELVEIYVHSPNTPSWRSAQLKHRDYFIFTFTFNISCYFNNCPFKVSIRSVGLVVFQLTGELRQNKSIMTISIQIEGLSRTTDCFNRDNGWENPFRTVSIEYVLYTRNWDESGLN